MILAMVQGQKEILTAPEAGSPSKPWPAECWPRESRQAHRGHNKTQSLARPPELDDGPVVPVPSCWGG